MMEPGPAATGEKPFSPSERRLRRFFQTFNRCMLALWRIGDGRLLNAWPAVGGRIMVLGHTGRRSGRRLHSPLNYAEHDGSVYCTAGFGSRADWYRNLLADPHVEVWLPGRRWRGIARDAGRDPDAVDRLRRVLVASGFAAYAAGLNPRRMSDEQGSRLLDAYRLVRIQPQERAETGA